MDSCCKNDRFCVIWTGSREYSDSAAFMEQDDWKDSSSSRHSADFPSQNKRVVPLRSTIYTCAHAPFLPFSKVPIDRKPAGHS